MSFSKTSQNGTAVRCRHTFFFDRARPGASRISHISTCVTLGANALELCFPTSPPSPPPSLFQATQFLPSALSSDPLHDRIGGLNWNSHTVRVSHFHLFIYFYEKWFTWTADLFRLHADMHCLRPQPRTPRKCLFQSRHSSFRYLSALAFCFFFVFFSHSQTSSIRLRQIVENVLMPSIRLPLMIHFFYAVFLTTGSGINDAFLFFFFCFGA